MFPHRFISYFILTHSATPLSRSVKCEDDYK